MTTKDFLKKIKKYSPCEDAVIDWEKNYKTLEEGWGKCERGDWLLWLCGKLEVDRKRLVLAACDCAELSLKHVPKGEDKPKEAIQTTRKWAKGKATLDKVKAAADDTYSAAADDTYSAAYAAYAAAYSAAYSTAYSAAYTAAYSAAYSAYSADTAAAYADARKKTLKKCADITRKYFTIQEIKKAL